MEVQYASMLRFMFAKRREPQKLGAWDVAPMADAYARPARRWLLVSAFSAMAFRRRPDCVADALPTARSSSAEAY